MRILFLTSGLSRRADGVGDYCRRLAEALQGQGHRVSLMALNDPFLTHGVDPCSSEEPVLEVVRLSSTQPWTERIHQARASIESFAPDWISLHFVCYGFHRRGLVGKLVSDLARLCDGYQLHVMMHELWVMWGMDCRLQDRMIGLLQRRGVVRLLKALRPSLIDTTIPFYQAVLRHEGFQAGLLPLCGNFPVVEGDARSWLPQCLEAEGLPSLWPRSEPLVVAGFFGTIFGHWDPSPLLKRLASEAAQQKAAVLLLSGGSCSEDGGCLFDQLPSKVDGTLFYRCRLGRLSDEQASQYFHSLDLGLSCYSKLFIGKSSVFATMVDHGLTVVAGGADDRLERCWDVKPSATRAAGLNDCWSPISDDLVMPNSTETATGQFLSRLVSPLPR